MSRKFTKEFAHKIIEKLNGIPNIKRIIPEKVDVLRYFINIPGDKDYSESVILNFVSIPSIILIGESGRIYLFSLKALFNEEEIKNLLLEDK